MPLSSDSRINKEEVLELLTEAVERMPDELRSARWLLKEREEFLAKVRREGDELLELARARAERMVERTEIVRAAEQRARTIVEGAESEARRMRHEVEDFCDRKLASFEVVLQKTVKLVGQGRARMQGVPVATPERRCLLTACPRSRPRRPRPTCRRSSTKTGRVSDDEQPEPDEPPADPALVVPIVEVTRRAGTGGPSW